MTILILMIALATALPIPKNGPCPTGYSTSAKFCVPNRGAGTAVPITPSESCPSGMTRSGRYCVSRPDHR
jgi:hypothetical protein